MLKGCLKQVRDYIHVMDLADGHIAALKKLFADPEIGITLSENLTVKEFSYDSMDSSQSETCVVVMCQAVLLTI